MISMLHEVESSLRTISLNEFWAGPSVLANNAPHALSVGSVDDLHTREDGFVRMFYALFDELVSDRLILLDSFKELLS